MAANAIQRAALHEEAVRRVEQLQALQTVERAITASLDLRLSLNVLLEQTLAQLRAAAVGVLLYDPAALSLNYAAGRGFRARNYERARVRLGEGQEGCAALEQRVIHVADIARCDPPFVRLPLLTNEGFVSYAAAPLISKGQLKGMLEVFHRNPFQPGDGWTSHTATTRNGMGAATRAG